MEFEIIRFHTDAHATCGVFLADKRPLFCSLELPWFDNQQNISCIPLGCYVSLKGNHDRLGRIVSLRGVEGREGILIHSANQTSELRGCIALGMEWGDGQLRILRSKEALEKLHSLLNEKPFVLRIASNI